MFIRRLSWFLWVSFGFSPIIIPRLFAAAAEKKLSVWEKRERDWDRVILFSLTFFSATAKAYSFHFVDWLIQNLFLSKCLIYLLLLLLVIIKHSLSLSHALPVCANFQKLWSDGHDLLVLHSYGYLSFIST